MKNVTGLLVWVAIGLFWSTLCVGGWVFSSYHEAKIFTKMTGREVTTWDAMFVQLRIDDD